MNLSKFSKKLFASISLVGFVAQAAQANLQSLAIKPETEFATARWIYDAKPAAPAKDRSGKYGELVRAKEALLKGQPAVCVQELRKAYPKNKNLQPWIITVELECALEEAEEKKSTASLYPSIVTLEKDMSRLFVGAQASRARNSWVQARMKLLEGDIKTNRVRAWESAEKLQKLIAHVDKKDRANLYRAMGELAFIQQRWEAARDYFNRSLKENDNDELRGRIKAVESILPKKVKDVEPAKSEQVTNASLEASADELELVQKITVALAAGELLAAVETSVKLLRAFPGGVRAKWAAERVLEAYLSLIEKTDPKYGPIRENVVVEMAKADSERLTEWARVIYNRAQYSDSLMLAERAIANAERGIPNARMYELAADSAMHLEKYNEARKHYQILITQYGGTTSAREALLRSALIDYRRAEYISTVTQLERLLVLPQSENYEVIARYWLWRSLQKLKSDQAQSAADALIAKYPFSYYGLRAQIEKSNGILEKAAGKEDLQTTLWITGTEKENFDRVKSLLAAGWLEEGQAELKSWPDPVRPRDKAAMALIHAAAFGYGTAVRLSNEAWDEDPSLRKEPLFGAAFPPEFKTEIQKQASARKVDPKLVSALIKQESAYQVRAVSSSSAYGLMQMIPPTAREIADALKIKDLEIPKDMFVPATNIRMGTYYLAEMLEKYNGHVPLALASYNAGPTRIDRWLRARPSLQKLSFVRSNNPDDELWYDEIPWSETSFYVKAILRNYLLYQLFEHGKVAVSFPVWSEGSVKPSPRTPASLRSSPRLKSSKAKN
jgi:soluble lytic murein transglycosylase